MYSLPSVWLLILAAALVLCLPVILTQSSILGRNFDFTNSGQIGDTIGGITSPFFNLIAAVLIFLSFREQVKTNRDFIRSSKLEKEHNILAFIAEKIVRADFTLDEEDDNIKQSLFERLDITYSTALKHSIDTFVEAFNKAEYDHTSFKEIKKVHEKYKETRSNVLITPQEES